jgi:hypothetical protein
MWNDLSGDPLCWRLPLQDGISWSAEYQLPELIIIWLVIRLVELLDSE